MARRVKASRPMYDDSGWAKAGRVMEGFGNLLSQSGIAYTQAMKMEREAEEAKKQKAMDAKYEELVKGSGVGVSPMDKLSPPKVTQSAATEELPPSYRAEALVGDKTAKNLITQEAATQTQETPSPFSLQGQSQAYGQSTPIAPASSMPGQQNMVSGQGGMMNIPPEQLKQAQEVEKRAGEELQKLPKAIQDDLNKLIQTHLMAFMATGNIEKFGGFAKSISPVLDFYEKQRLLNKKPFDDWFKTQVKIRMPMTISQKTGLAMQTDKEISMGGGTPPPMGQTIDKVNALEKGFLDRMPPIGEYPGDPVQPVPSGVPVAGGLDKPMFPARTQKPEKIPVSAKNQLKTSIVSLNTLDELENLASSLDTGWENLRGPVWGPIGNVLASFGVSGEKRQEFVTLSGLNAIQKIKNVVGGRVAGWIYKDLKDTLHNIRQDPEAFQGAMNAMRKQLQEIISVDSAIHGIPPEQLKQWKDDADAVREMLVEQSSERVGSPSRTPQKKPLQGGKVKTKEDLFNKYGLGKPGESP